MIWSNPLACVLVSSKYNLLLLLFHSVRMATIRLLKESSLCSTKANLRRAGLFFSSSSSSCSTTAPLKKLGFSGLQSSISSSNTWITTTNSRGIASSIYSSSPPLQSKLKYHDVRTSHQLLQSQRLLFSKVMLLHSKGDTIRAPYSTVRPSQVRRLGAQGIPSKQAEASVQVFDSYVSGAKLQKTVEKLQESIDSLQKMVGKLQESIDSLQKMVGKLQESIDSKLTSDEDWVFGRRGVGWQAEMVKKQNVSESKHGGKITEEPHLQGGMPKKPSIYMSPVDMEPEESVPKTDPKTDPKKTDSRFENVKAVLRHAFNYYWMMILYWNLLVMAHCWARDGGWPKFPFVPFKAFPPPS